MEFPYPIIKNLEFKYIRLNDILTRYKISSQTLIILQKIGYDFFKHSPESGALEINNLQMEVDQIISLLPEPKIDYFLSKLSKLIHQHINLYLSKVDEFESFDFASLAESKKQAIISELTRNEWQIEQGQDFFSSSDGVVKLMNRNYELQERLNEAEIEFGFNWMRYVYEHSQIIRGILTLALPSTARELAIDNQDITGLLKLIKSAGNYVDSKNIWVGKKFELNALTAQIINRGYISGETGFGNPGLRLAVAVTLFKGSISERAFANAPKGTEKFNFIPQKPTTNL